jgi:hypothetical protein
VADLFGTVWHPAMQWGAITGVLHEQIRLDDDSYLAEPDEGRLALPQLATLATLLAENTTTPDAATVGIWTGWGDLRADSGSLFAVITDGPVDSGVIAEREARFRAERSASVDPEISRASEAGPRLLLPHREYVLLDADVREFADTDWTTRAGIGWHAGSGPTPNLLWPADRAWFVASEIDFDSTIVGGTRALIDALATSDGLEAAKVTEDTDLSYRADAINPPPRNL